MRDALPTDRGADHAGLAHDVWCRHDAALGDTTGAREARDSWMGKLVGLTVPQGYDRAYEVWLDSFIETGAELSRGQLLGPLLVGHGNPSPSQVGLTLHHTWGVPVIPGSALKGLAAHYLAACYGADPGRHPGDPQHPDASRAGFQAPQFDAAGRLEHGPGAVYRALFGAPSCRSDEESGGGACGAGVQFHDALLDPTGVALLFVRDVLTPHHAGYLKGEGADWPNDYEDPNPISFVSVRPGLKLLFAVTGPAKWARLALEVLREALADWGAGGKTARGYGRFSFDPDADAAWIKDRRVRTESRRIATSKPAARWRTLVKREPEATILEWARGAFDPSAAWNPAATARELEGLRLDADTEREAFRAALEESGHLTAWSAGQALVPGRLGVGQEKLRERAAAVRGSSGATAPEARDAGLDRLAAVGANDFAALQLLGMEAMREPTSWSLAAVETLLQRVRNLVDRRAKATKRAFRKELEGYVGERRRGGS